MDTREATIAMAVLAAAYVDVMQTGQCGPLTTDDETQLLQLRTWLQSVADRYMGTHTPLGAARIRFRMPYTNEVIDASTVDEAIRMVNAERIARGKPPLSPSQVAVVNAGTAAEANRMLGLPPDTEPDQTTEAP